MIQYIQKLIFYYGISIYFIITHILLSRELVYYSFAFNITIKISKIITFFLICIDSLSFPINKLIANIWIFLISLIQLAYLVLHSILFYESFMINDSHELYRIWEYTNNIHFWITTYTYFTFNNQESLKLSNEINNIFCIFVYIIKWFVSRFKYFLF